jgi:hypothetical protein
VYVFNSFTVINENAFILHLIKFPSKNTKLPYIFHLVRRIRWTGHVARMWEVRSAYILVGRPEGRRPLGRPRRRWENNIKMDLREIWFGDVDWIHWA